MEWLLSLSEPTVSLSQLGKQAKVVTLGGRARDMPVPREAGLNSID